LPVPLLEKATTRLCCSALSLNAIAAILRLLRIRTGDWAIRENPVDGYDKASWAIVVDRGKIARKNNTEIGV
jgi:hypothetical protein